MFANQGIICKMNDFIYKVNGNEYPVHIIYKRIKNIHFRFIDGAFVVSCNRYTLKKQIVSGLEKYGESLIKRSTKPQARGEDYIYLLGVKINIHNYGEINFNDGSKISYSSKEDLDKKLKKYFLSFITRRVEYYTKIMGVPLYKVTVKDMKSRFGSNSKYTKSLHFSTILMHYSLPIIDSVVVHELAHILVYDHSKKFYDVVYKYCPDYDLYRKKIIKGEFQ